MFIIDFYQTADGHSDVRKFLENLRKKKPSDKNTRIQYNQVALYIQLLQEKDTRLSSPFTKHIQDGIWELCPGDHRIFYFFYEDDTYVLLHHFRKKTQKTPRREIAKAISERADYLSRKEKRS